MKDEIVQKGKESRFHIYTKCVFGSNSIRSVFDLSNTWKIKIFKC